MTKHLSEAERRAQILAAAREEFMLHGYADTRVGDVARRASLSKGAVYFYDPSKRDLFMALVLAEHETTYAFLESSEASEAPALVRLVSVGREYVEYFFGLATPPRFFLMMTELGVRDEDIRAECEALHQRFVDAVARIFAQGMVEGAFRQMDPVAVAQMLKALIDGVGGQAAIGIAPDRDRLALEGFRTILRGILADPDHADVVLAALEGAVALEPPASME
jgi:AcrR family transcriptional regulator